MIQRPRVLPFLSLALLAVPWAWSEGGTRSGKGGFRGPQTTNLGGNTQGNDLNKIKTNTTIGAQRLDAGTGPNQVNLQHNPAFQNPGGKVELRQGAPVIQTQGQVLPGGGNRVTIPGGETGLKAAEEQKTPGLEIQAGSEKAAALGQTSAEQNLTAAPKGVDAGVLKGINAENAALKNNEDTLGVHSKGVFDALRSGQGKVSGPGQSQVVGKTQSSPEQVKGQVDLFVGEGERLADKKSPTASRDVPKAPFAYEKALEATQKALGDKVIAPDQAREFGAKIHKSMLRQVQDGSLDKVAENIRDEAGRGSAGETAFKENVGSLDKWRENFGIRWRPLLSRGPSLPLVRNSSVLDAEIKKAEKELPSKPVFPRVWFEDQKDGTFIAEGLPKVPGVPQAQALANPIEGSPEAAALTRGARTPERAPVGPVETAAWRMGKSLYEGLLSLLRRVVSVKVELGEGMVFRSGELFAAKRLASLKRALSEEEKGFLKEAAGSSQVRVAFLDLGPVRQNLLQAAKDLGGVSFKSPGLESLEWLARTYARLSRRDWILRQAARFKSGAAPQGIDRMLDHVGAALWDWVDRRFLLILEKEGRLHFVYGDLSSPQGTLRIVSRAALSEPLLQGLWAAGFTVKEQEGQGFWIASLKEEDRPEQLSGMLAEALSVLSGKTRAAPAAAGEAGAAAVSELEAFLGEGKGAKDANDPRWQASDPAQASPLGTFYFKGREFFVELHAKPGQAPYYRLTDTGDTAKVYVREVLSSTLAKPARPASARLPVAR